MISKPITSYSFCNLRMFVTGAILLFAMTAMAQPVPNGQIPVDKKLDPVWVKSLYESGSPTVYLKSRNELKYIGMPVGGINAGGVYLGGDGRLWLWEIFNEAKEGIKEGIDPKIVEWTERTTSSNYIRSRDGASYVEPAQNIRPFQQGFLLRIDYDGQTFYKTLEESSWDEIAFEATYPVGVVHYMDKKIPLELTLHAYSPFIPLNADDSGLPATILSFSAKNKSSQAMKISFVGYLENKVGLRSANVNSCRRQNEAEKENEFTAVSEKLIIFGKNNQHLEEKPDYGSMCIAALNPQSKAYCDFAVNPATAFSGKESTRKSSSLNEELVGAVQSDLTLAGNASGNAHFVVSWYFPNLMIYEKLNSSGRYYQNKFASATAVAKYIKTHFERLSSTTLKWKDTWQNTTLPQWFMERTFLTINTLATDNCVRFSNGRFWAWEGVGACGGTCTHVWQYAQALARIFPELERDCRERTDLNIAMQPDGGIIFRAELQSRPAIDGQAGSILRCYREHQMSSNDEFLKRNWPQIKKGVEFLINQDKNGDGMEDTPMENTLDAIWDGEIAWIVDICIAGVRAGQAMAEEAGDREFAEKCAEYVKKGSANMDKYLFNGEYYIHRPDKEKGRENLGSYNTSHIDQVLGQAWAFQVGLGRIQDQKKTLSALRSLWKYNFTPDVGPYIAVHRGGRPYALPGEGGMIMNTNPKNEAKPYGENVTWQMGYFHECMSGFEHQVAAHMIAEGMTDEGLVLTRFIHDRYHAAKRNPFNEIECSDHYARAMSSYGSFITACGFEYHGPKGYMRFAPKWSRDNFKAPFTAAEGWGTYTQQQSAKGMECSLQPAYGQVQLQSFSVDAPKGTKYKKAAVAINGKSIPAQLKQNGQSVMILFEKRTTIEEGQMLSIRLS